MPTAGVGSNSLLTFLDLGASVPLPLRVPKESVDLRRTDFYPPLPGTEGQETGNCVSLSLFPRLCPYPALQHDTPPDVASGGPMSSEPPLAHGACQFVQRF